MARARTSLAYFFLILPSVVSSEYVPGSPGAPWSQEELLTVRSKLWRLYAKKSFLSNLWKKGYVPNDLPEPNDSIDIKFFPAKVLRLRYYLGSVSLSDDCLVSFHDCLKYTDGTGGEAGSV